MLRIDMSDAAAAAQLAAIGERLAGDADVVSQAARQRTLDVFGAPLTPREVVDRIAADVKNRGVAAVVEYSAALDGRHLDSTELAVPDAELQQAHQAAEPEFLQTIRRIRQRIEVYQRAIRHADVESTLR